MSNFTCFGHAVPFLDQNRTIDDRQGWTASPNTRGTIDIISNCALTMFLCCWSVLVVNVEEPKSSPWQIFIRKLLLLGLCAIAPEVIFVVALGQWLSAHRSVKLFHAAAYSEWTVRHGFYADMGGFHLRTPDWKSFPINAKQLHYLVVKGYVDYPSLQDSHIRDKDKADGLIRFVTLMQTVWFMANVIARASQHLAVTALELSTSAFVMLNIATTLCWLQKPADVHSPDYIETTTTIAEILLDAGEEAARVYSNTPLDFVSRQEWSFSIMWAHGLNILRKMNLAAPPQQRPINRFQNTVVPVIDGPAHLLIAIMSSAYFAIFIAGWNFSFPTTVEKSLWRAATLTALISATAKFYTLELAFSWYPNLRRKLRLAAEQYGVAGRELWETTAESRRKRDASSVWRSYLKNNSTLKDPALDAPVGAVITIWVLGIFYCSARAYIILADFMELRSLPTSAYQEVNWLSAWPHF